MTNPSSTLLLVTLIAFQGFTLIVSSPRQRKNFTIAAERAKAVDEKPEERLAPCKETNNNQMSNRIGEMVAYKEENNDNFMDIIQDAYDEYLAPLGSRGVSVRTQRPFGCGIMQRLLKFFAGKVPDVVDSFTLGAVSRFAVSDC